MVLLSHDLVAVAGRGGNRNRIGGGGSDTGSKSEGDRQVADGKGELIEGVVNIFKAGFKDKIGRSVRAGGIIDSVGKGIVGRIFLAGGDVEITPINIVVGGGKVLGKNVNGQQRRTNDKN